MVFSLSKLIEAGRELGTAEARRGLATRNIARKELTSNLKMPGPSLDDTRVRGSDRLGCAGTGLAERTPQTRGSLQSDEAESHAVPSVPVFEPISVPHSLPPWYTSGTALEVQACAASLPRNPPMIRPSCESGPLPTWAARDSASARCATSCPSCPVGTGQYGAAYPES